MHALFVVFDLVLFCGVTVVSSCCVAAERKGVQGLGQYIVPSLGRDSSPPLTFRLWYSHICAEKGR